MRRNVITTVAALFLLASFKGTDAQTRHLPVSKKCRCTTTANSAGAIKTASGLTYMIFKKGRGRLPKKGETVIYHYTGTFTNGAKFESSRDRNDPFSFKLGAGQVIKGVDEAIAKLHIGDHAIMVLPPEIAYGAKGVSDVIPPNSTLIFLVEILDIRETTLSDVLLNVQKSSGGAAMLARYRELKQKGFGDIYVSESDLDGLGYTFLKAKQIDDAISIYKLNVEEHPGSANSYDSLGEAYVAGGKKQLAIESYTKALEIDPKLPSSIKALEKLRKDH